MKPTPSPSSNGPKRWLLLGVGYVSVGLGVLGIFLPLLPTTPFLLLAAACYARSSDSAYQKLLRNRYLGQYIRDYRAGRGVPLRAKATSITLIWVSIGYTVYAVVDWLWLDIVLLMIATGVTLHLLRLPTLKPDNPET